MLRINQFAKEIGVSNHDVIEALEKHLNVTGKSHSSNLSDDQIVQLRRIFEAKSKGIDASQPLAIHKPTAAVRVVKGAPASRPEPSAAEPAPAPAPAPMLVKRAPASEPSAPTPVSEARSDSAPSAGEVSEGTSAPSVSGGGPSPASEREAARPDAPAPRPSTPTVPAPSEFSRLRVSQTPTPAPKPQEPARYIQLPQAPSGSRPRSEAGAKPVVQRPSQPAVQRSGMPQPERAPLPMATNTTKGEVKPEAPAAQPAPTSMARRLAALPGLSQLQPDQGFTKIKMSDTPPPAPRPQHPARYIQLPQPQPRSQGGRPSGPGGRPGARPSGSGGRPGGAGARPGGPGRPGMGPRPGMGRPGLPPASVGPIPPDMAKGSGRGPGSKKKGKHERPEEEEMAQRLRQPRSKAQQVATEYVEEEIGIVMLSEGVTVKELAEKCNRPAKDVMAKLLHRGIMATINQPLDPDLAKEIAREFGYLADIVSFEEDVQLSAEESGEVVGEKVPRSPVVTIMGHVDHGKTSLLDAIRSTKVAATEAGGITQAIGAYHVDVKDPNTGDLRQVVFIDTPGHEAFTKMRARGAKVTDIVILVVAADDGVMPQTIEAINHTKAADVPMVVAINKIDKPQANPDRVQQMLLQHGVQTEAYGGNVPSVPVSAKTKQGLDELLETVLLVADLQDLKAVADCPATGSILEAKLDRGRGPVATVLVQQGTLRAGDVFVAGATMGRVRAMFDDRGRKVTESGPSTAVQILGFETVPTAGDTFQVVEDEGKARQIVTFRQEKAKAAAQAKTRVTLENLFSTLKEGEVKELPLIVKADTQGSVESLVGSLEKLSTDKVRVRIIHAAVGTVTENDVLLAEASNATIIAFAVKPERKAEELAQEEGVDIRYHDIIYKVTEEVTNAMVGLLAPVEKEVVQGHAEVRQVFKVQKHAIAGSYVQDGLVKRAFLVRVKRRDEVIFEGSLRSLKRFKDDVNEVKAGYECGIGIEGFDDLQEGDILEFFSKEKTAATTLG